MKTMFYICRAIMYPVAAMLCPCKVMDKEKYKKLECGHVTVSNHLSWMDIPYQMFWLPGYKRMLSKKENEGGKFKHWLLWNMGVIFIDRDKPELSVMRTCINSLKNDGEIMMVYPEGTRNKVDREIQAMHSGAAMFALKGDARVTPVVIHHKGKPFHRNYIGVGDEVDIDDFRGKKLDDATLNEVTERFRVAMKKTLEKLDVWVAEKGWKKDKKERRRKKRQLKAQYRAAKSAARKAVK